MLGWSLQYWNSECWWEQLGSKLAGIDIICFSLWAPASLITASTKKKKRWWSEKYKWLGYGEGCFSGNEITFSEFVESGTWAAASFLFTLALALFLFCEEAVLPDVVHLFKRGLSKVHPVLLSSSSSWASLTISSPLFLAIASLSAILLFNSLIALSLSWFDDWSFSMHARSPDNFSFASWTSVSLLFSLLFKLVSNSSYWFHTNFFSAINADTSAFFSETRVSNSWFSLLISASSAWSWVGKSPGDFWMLSSCNLLLLLVSRGFSWEPSCKIFRSQRGEHVNYQRISHHERYYIERTNLSIRALCTKDVEALLKISQCELCFICTWWQLGH